MTRGGYLSVGVFAMLFWALAILLAVRAFETAPCRPAFPVSHYDQTR
jgi:hypothetical protein